MAEQIWLGVLLAVLASMSGTIGKQLLRFSELKTQKGSTSLAAVAFVVGLTLNVAIGPFIDLSSYAFAPQTLIAPLCGLDVVWNTMLAPCTLGEKLTPKLVKGVVCIAIGAIGTSLFGHKEDKEYTLQVVQDTFVRPTVCLYLSCLALWLAFNILVLQAESSAPKETQPWYRANRIRGLSLGMTAGSLAGNMFCAKAFVELVQTSIRQGDAEVLAHWITWVMLAGAVFFALSNLFFLQKAAREYQALFMGSVFVCAHIISACLSGYVVFADAENLAWWQVSFYWVMLMFVVAGIVIVAAEADGSLHEKECALPAVADSEQSPLKSDSNTG